MEIKTTADAEAFGHVIALEAAIKLLATEIARISDNREFLAENLDRILKRLQAARAILPFEGEQHLRDVVFVEAEGVARSIFGPRNSEN